MLSTLIQLDDTGFFNSQVGIRMIEYNGFPLQKDRPRHSTRDKKKRKANEMTGRQHPWTDLDLNSSQRAAEDRQRWENIVADVNSVVQQVSSIF